MVLCVTIKNFHPLFSIDQRRINHGLRSWINRMFFLASLGSKHGPNIYKDNPQMSSLLVSKRVYRLEIQSVMLVFSTVCL
jgi:hypothetical protein